jgi:hypothetical protein
MSYILEDNKEYKLVDSYTQNDIKYLLLISDDNTLLIRKIVNNNDEVICRLDEDEYDLVYNKFVLKNSKED